jgi:hypothetical protein
MADDPFSGEKSVTSDQPTAADYEPEVRLFRSLAAIAVVYGTAGVMLVPFGLFRFHQGAIPGDFEIHLFDKPVVSTSIQALWLLVSSLSGGGLGLALMVGAIGGVALRGWALPVLKMWSIASIIFGVIGCWFFFQWLLPPWRDQLADVRGVDDALFNLGGWMIGSLLGIAILIVINRPAVSAALRRNGAITKA